MIDLGDARPSSVMFYCHDTFGLGHLRRTLTLANHLRGHFSSLSQLIVTGSPVAHNFSYPDGSDYVKLPSVVKTGADQYEARSIDTDFTHVRDMRRDILLSAARHFQPDVLIVDHAPAGLKGEIVETLRYLKAVMPRTKLAIGLRDVVDDAPVVRRAWAKDGVYELLDDIYDRIFVYGRQDFYDVEAEYGLSARAAAKTRFVGYLGREPGSRTRDEIRASLPLRHDRLVVVTAGGGGDGADLFRAMLDAPRARRGAIDFDCLLVGGPLMSEADRSELRAMSGNGSSLHFLEFAEDMTSYLAAADAVVAMGGYNTVCEILSLGRPAVIVPRVSPRKEQLIRAEFLARRGLVTMIHPRDLTAPHLLDAIDLAIATSRDAPPWLPMDGLVGVTHDLGQLFQTAGTVRPRYIPSLGDAAVAYA